ncbi:MAG: metalloregulator ArsR/SmtB family transcription factor [Bacillales bacterium]|nr:metalloregulator ArsR/SmtB family transcription factor [Bacillales bacterium]
MKEFDQDELLLRTAEFYKALSDYSRFKIVYSLMNGEKCVGDIEKEVEMSQTAVSYQLKLLRQMHLVKYRRKGQNVLYSIDDQHVLDIINLTLTHIKED